MECPASGWEVLAMLAKAKTFRENMSKLETATFVLFLATGLALLAWWVN